MKYSIKKLNIYTLTSALDVMGSSQHGVSLQVFKIAVLGSHAYAAFKMVRYTL